MKTVLPLIAVIILVLLAFVGVKVANLQYLFGVVIPYAALAVFVLGFIYRIVKWGKSAVPFSIPTTAGQQKTLPWIKQNKLDNPSTTLGVIGRMALEVLVFRSLFRNTKTELREGPRVSYGSEKFLWMAGLVFHWSFLIIVIRHLRFFTQNVPFVVSVVESLDSFLQIGIPILYMTDVLILLAITYLFLRRISMPLIKFISLPADYFPLFLIFGIVVSGMMMRYYTKVYVVGVKELAMGLVSFSPVAMKTMQGIGVVFYIHLFLICMLFAYFPFSKLMHMGGVFLSPTRNMPNNSRMIRHINPWDHPVHVHTYEEYEDDFREKMKKAGLPVEKE